MAAHFQDIPYPLRIMHWVNLVSMASLIYTGLSIRYHWLESHALYTYLCKKHHYYFIYILLGNLLVRIIYAFASETKTYKDFTIGMADIKNSPAVLKYYLFLQDDYPHISKYASFQKLTYNFFWIFSLIQGYIGFAILKPRLLASFFGPPEVTAIWARNIHTAIMGFFIITISIHMYIAFIEGFPLLKLILFGIEPKEKH